MEMKNDIYVKFLEKIYNDLIENIDKCFYISSVLSYNDYDDIFHDPCLFLYKDLFNNKFFSFLSFEEKTNIYYNSFKEKNKVYLKNMLFRQIINKLMSVKVIDINNRRFFLNCLEVYENPIKLKIFGLLNKYFPDYDEFSLLYKELYTHIAMNFVKKSGFTNVSYSLFPLKI
jgi:hypothetical protein